MSERIVLRREDLANAFGNNKRLIRAFEEQARAVDDNSQVITETLQSTDAIQDATVLTLSPNASFTNERVLGLGEGLEGEDTGSVYIIRLSDSAPIVNGGFSLNIVVSGDSTVRVPLTGQLATTENTETLKRKTLDTPKVSGIGNFADDAAAAVGGVPLGGVYHNGGVLRMRII